MIYRKSTGADHCSDVVRPTEQKLLKKIGVRVRVLELSGFLFFGSTNQILSTVKACKNLRFCFVVHAIVFFFFSRMDALLSCSLLSKCVLTRAGNLFSCARTFLSIPEIRDNESADSISRASTLRADGLHQRSERRPFLVSDLPRHPTDCLCQRNHSHLHRHESEGMFEAGSCLQDSNFVPCCVSSWLGLRTQPQRVL